MTAIFNPTSWMQDSINEFGDLTIRQLSVPGAHDAGMSCKNRGTAFASDCNVITQYNPILEQLNLGVRYFDIRPVISDGQFFTGHYTNTGVPLIGWQGANGQSIDSIISDINNFCSSQNELIILRLSHDLNTDCGREYQPFTQEQYDDLCSSLEYIHNRYTKTCPNLLDLTLKECLISTKSSNPRPCVIIIMAPELEGIKPKEGSGVYPASAYKIYDSYTDTNDVKKMSEDQLIKMHNNHGYFMLNWILTQSDIQAATCAIGEEKSILQLAEAANEVLVNNLLPASLISNHPNVILLDGIKNSQAAELAFLLNKYAVGLIRND